MREAPEYITISELAEAVGVPVRRIQYEFRVIPGRGQIKRGGRWLIPLANVHPVLRRKEFETEREQIKELWHEFTLEQIIGGCDLLGELTDWKLTQAMYKQSGKSTKQARRLMCEHKNISVEDYVSMRRFYRRKGLRGCIRVYYGSQRRAVATAAAFRLAIAGKGDYEILGKLTINGFCGILNGLKDGEIECIRMELEEPYYEWPCYGKEPEIVSYAGMEAARTNPNRRIYAPLKPTRGENLQRILYVLKSLEAETLRMLLARYECELGEPPLNIHDATTQQKGDYYGEKRT